MKWYKKSHWRIILGLILGMIYGVIAAFSSWGEFTQDWVSPFGEVFLNSLKLVGVPLVLGSLVSGVASLSDVAKLSRIGSKTVGLYVLTTFIAVTLGIVLVNIVRPGDQVPETMRVSLQDSYYNENTINAEDIKNTRERGPLDIIVKLVPQNFFATASDNSNMLQVVFIAIFIGIGPLSSYFPV
ncbi:MAG: Na+/H+-dicarboxylate symporter [Pseudohongiellaceae bacterium]|jgi:Na+/H+-dicarboxylate symporter